MAVITSKKIFYPFLFWLVLLVGCVSVGCTRSPSSSNAYSQHSDQGIKSKNQALNAKLGRGRCSEEFPSNLYAASADALFAAERLPTFDIDLPQERWQSLLKNAAEEQYTEAEVCYENLRIGTVGLRIKGSYGALYSCIDAQGHVTCPRLSLKLKFNKYNKQLRFFGLKRLNFNANRYDDSHMREKLAYDLYRSMGIKAPRASWAKVRVNGQDYGLYGMVEQVDGAFVKNRWPSYAGANLYKEIWPTQTNVATVAAGLKTNTKTADVSNFIEFSNAIGRANSDEAVLAALATYTDLDAWARYLAVDEAILSYDGITYFFTDDGQSGSNHNFLFYENAPKRFSLIPWDVESSFWINPDHAPPHWTVTPADCQKTYPYWQGYAIAPGCDSILKALQKDRKRWHAAMQVLLDGPFSEAAMYKAIERHVALIGDAARAPETPQRFISFDQAVMYLRSVIPQLRDRMQAFIAEETLAVNEP